MKKRTTMHDIAKALDISVNAVSIALNDREGVSHSLRMQVLEKALEMKYPLKNLNVKATLKNKTLVIMIEKRKANDTYYYLDLLSRLEEEATIFGYRILVEYYDTQRFVVPKIISERHCVGVIILGKIKDAIIEDIQSYMQEIICINHSIPYLSMDTILTNNFLGGYISCEYLIKKGYKNIGFIGEIDSSKNFKERYQGYRQCMINHFQSKKHDLVCLTKGIENAVFENNYQYIQKMLLLYRNMPEAFVCVNDRNAAIVMKALRYNGYKIPEDIKIIGFDNMELCTKVKPNLTSLEVNKQVIAKKAIRRIHEVIREYTIPEVIMLSPQIIERESTK